MIKNKEAQRVKKTRDIQLDFVRVVATFFVMSVHFFLKTGFYKQQIIGWESFVQIRSGQIFTGKNLEDIRNIMTAVKPEGISSDKYFDKYVLIIDKPLILYYT